MEFYVVSPNASNNGSEQPIWENIIVEESVALMGWGPQDKFGKIFSADVHNGDFILIAQGANQNKKVLMGGVVSSIASSHQFKNAPRPIFFRKLSNVLTKESLEALSLDFVDSSWGAASQIPAIYKLHPASNEKDRVITDKLTTALIDLEKNAVMKQVSSLLLYRKQIILQGPPGTGKTRLANEIAKQLVLPLSRAELIRKVIRKYLISGLVVPMSQANKSVEVLVVNEDNFRIKKPSGDEVSQTIQSVYDVLERGEFTTKGGDSYHIALAKYLNQILLKTIPGEAKLIQFHPAYTYEDFVRGIVVETNEDKQVEYKVVNKTLADFAQKALNNEFSNYVLIIDEINRANLPSVLGELIYALEYRYDSEKSAETSVESMYALKSDDGIERTDSRVLRIPKNLYIIGTMNTADRSVGHIDYAIRRRFAFVDVLPSDQPIRDVIENKQTLDKALELFQKVSALFQKEYMNSDFDAQEVQLGHSYFLAKDEATLKLKLDFEIKPLLKEYVKDGILNEKAAEKIKELSL
jgi:MoxR-like ATPase